jgi:TRAP-type C4-dicarboxylate transport system permease small subunit
MRRVFALIAFIASVARWLVLPLAVLLFLQWPLRDLFHAYSRQANDAAQWLFALYVSVAVSAASQAGTHLTASALIPIHHWVFIKSRIYVANLCIFLCGVYVLWMLAPNAWQSLMQLERFPDTLNPGYFLIKLAAGLLAVLMMAQALHDLITASTSTKAHS